MKYERFEDLPVWQAAIELSLRVDQLVKHRAFSSARRPGGSTLARSAVNQQQHRRGL